ncbi:MAG: CapA family protein [Acidobacteria bacterium]|nr:MAG: CapA family protein [Acidobacteriota bacterium]REK03979.1 MAG: CapA family protein [Acidobacteriota bacterium]REK15141.1 MAG: CapA family protein [Acidobacteriota bacterium]REK46231.1 MAG: CapA family protein [Acidobacteriota bacterium]
MIFSNTFRSLAAAVTPLLFLACFGSQTVDVDANKTSLLSEPPPAEKAESISIAAVGDIMLGSTFPNESRMPPNDGADLLDPVSGILRSADIAFGNLEGPLADSGASTKCRRGSTRCFAFRMPTRYAAHLKEAGFDVMSVANNHAGDFGASGRRTTRETLDGLGILHAGSDSGRYSTAFLTAGGKKIAFIAFATNSISLNVNNLSAARAAVERADRSADIVVVSFHGGAEGSAAKRVPNKTEIFYREKRGNLPLFSKTVIDAGADLVLGHGPHVLRGMEIYKDRLIAYSLGNFATYGWFRLEGDTAETLVLTVDIDPEGKFLKGKIHPFVLEGRGILTEDTSGSAIRTIRTLSTLDFPESAPSIDEDGSILYDASSRARRVSEDN